NINNAPPTVLAENLPGIGPAKARAIVSYREQHGPFKTLAELIQVKGIGELTLKKIRPLLTVEEYSSKNMDTGTLTKPVKSQAKVEADVVRAVQAAVNVARRYKHDKSSQP
ncbi:UNVERIFIED_CONTAM: hypothetical protein GTU68_005164, partial [Idotea baltica]|nr:hypothetical protein [Idotea baltica]